MGYLKKSKVYCLVKKHTAICLSQTDEYKNNVPGKFIIIWERNSSLLHVLFQILYTLDCSFKQLTFLTHTHSPLGLFLIAAQELVRLLPRLTNTSASTDGSVSIICSCKGQGHKVKHLNVKRWNIRKTNIPKSDNEKIHLND